MVCSVRSRSFPDRGEGVEPRPAGTEPARSPDRPRVGNARNELLVDRPGSLPSGLVRVIVLMRDDTHWSVVSFFDDEESARASEVRFEELGNEIPERVRGKRVSLESYEVAFDVEMTRAPSSG
jgi:hypothetical protein